MRHLDIRKFRLNCFRVFFFRSRIYLASPDVTYQGMEWAHPRGKTNAFEERNQRLNQNISY